MNELERELFEKQLNSLTKGFDYPRTPQVAAAVMKHIQPAPRRRFMGRPVAWAVAFVLILFSTLMLIPSARAAIIEFFQIGIVRILPRSSEVTPIPTTVTPRVTPNSLLPLLNRLDGQTTLKLAQQRASFHILLPDGFGEPDYVFAQEVEGTMVVLVWMDPGQPDQVLLSLHMIPSGSWAIQKVEPAVIERTEVNGNPAIWATGPYALKAYNGNIEFTRLIEGQVLIWAEGNVTYRLETAASLQEALRIAGSLQPYSP
jgi:hypothetical protein